MRTDPLARICLAHLSEEQQRAFERDLQLASVIQGQFLPQQNLQVDGWEFHYHYEPLGPVSGDYCDFVRAEGQQGESFFLFGDVSGKGISASLLMSQLHAIFRSLIATDFPLTELVGRANRLFNRSTMSLHFATLVCGRVFKTGEIELINAGHCPPLVISQRSVSPIDSTGLPLGMFYEGEYPTARLKLEMGDSLLLYTDGLTESRNGAGHEYGEDRLASLISARGRLSPQELIKTCLADVTTFRGNGQRTDDLTLMVLRRTE